MHPFDVDLVTDSGASFGPTIECVLDCDVAGDGEAVLVTHVWVPTYRRSGPGWHRDGEVDLLDPDVGTEAWRIGLMAKSQAEADPAFVSARLAEHRARLKDAWLQAREAARSG